MATGNSYGQIIRREREKQRLSIRRLAAKVDMAPSHLNRIENDTGNTNPQMLQRIANALAMNESKLIEAWLIRNLEGINYDPALLLQVRTPDMDFDQIETMYGIDKARAAYDKIKGCTTGKKMKTLKPETLFEVRLALMNCLGLIDDLR
jgi:transcriptional regulator with XRE-family HTH domain